MAALGSQSIASSYEQLLHTDADGGGNGTTLVSVKDGDNGTTFDIQLSSNSTNFQTDFQIGGTQVTSDAAELNLLDGSSAANSTVSKAVVLDASGNIALPDGKGIDFAATADSSGTMANELLDDYEEGTWTPTVTSGSGAVTVDSSYNTLYYTKVGRIVHLTGGFRISAVGSLSGGVFISNIPFTVADLTEEGGISAGSVYMTSLTGTINTVQIKTRPASTNLEMVEFDGSTEAGMRDHLQVGTRIAMSITYIA